MFGQSKFKFNPCIDIKAEVAIEGDPHSKRIDGLIIAFKSSLIKLLNINFFNNL